MIDLPFISSRFFKSKLSCTSLSIAISFFFISSFATALGVAIIANFLVPKKLAIIATPKAVAKLEMKKKEIAIEREVQESLLLKNLEEIKGKSIIIKGKANDKGHLFSAIHKKEILE